MYCQFLASEKGVDVPNIKQLFTSNIELNLPKLMSMETLKLCLSESFASTKHPYRNQCIIGCLFYAGCRVSEVVSMRVNHVFNDHLIIRGKGEKERIVPLSQPLKQRLFNYLNNERKATNSPWLLNHPSGTHMTRQSITGVIKTMCQRLGITERVTPHTFRHMFATHLLNKGMDIREVQLMLGHASINTTQIYTHLDKTKLRAVFQANHPLS